MEAAKIDFCEIYEFRFSPEKDEEKLHSKIYSNGENGYIIVNDGGEYSLRIHDVGGRISPKDDEDRDKLEKVDCINNNGGKVFLRVDMWKKEAGIVSFLVFSKEQIIVGPQNAKESWQIGVKEKKNIEIYNKHFVLEDTDKRKYILIRGTKNTDSTEEKNSDKNVMKGQLELDKFDLIGDTRFVQVERNSFSNSWEVSSRIRQRDPTAKIFGEIYLVADVQFVDGKAKENKGIEAAYKKAVDASNGQELLSLWKRYSDIEEDLEMEDALQFESHGLHYTFWQNYGNRIEFHCDRGTVKKYKECELGFAVVPEENGKIPKGWLTRDKQTYLSDKVEIPKQDNGHEIRVFAERPDAVIPERGYIVPSVVGMWSKNRRRSAASKSIQQMNCPLPSLKLIVQNGTGIKEMRKVSTIYDGYLKEVIFGKDSEEKLNAKQEEAIKIAVSTPDIALIQGPPGTGKTTVIKGILAYLEKEGRDKKTEYSVLVTSESHDAVDRAITETNYHGLPCKRLGGRFGEKESQSSFDTWFSGIKEKCDAYLNKTAPDQGKIGDKARSISASIYACRKCLQNKEPQADDLRDKLEKLEENTGTENVFFEKIHRIIDKLNKETFPENSKGELTAAIEEMLLYCADDWEDNGQDVFEIIISKMLQNQMPVPEEWKELRDCYGDEAEFKTLYGKVREELKERKEELLAGRDLVPIFEELSDLLAEVELQIREKYKSSEDRLAEIVYNFRNRVSDNSSVQQFYSNYAPYAGATCQQSATGRCGDIQIKPVKRYDYVIIDEAARSNPLDLLIPMSMGEHIIMIGDQNQLPHMVERKIEKELTSAREDTDDEQEATSKQSVGDILRESLFARIFGNLKDRTVMLEEQFRMHPEIAKLISDAFYESTIRSKDGIREKKIHSLQRYQGQPMVWIDIPYSENCGENRDGHSFTRKCEADRAIEELKEIVKNTESDFSIGIISFYSAQVDLIKKKAEADGCLKAEREIKIGTVDAFQGQEFDAVILSSVRSSRGDDTSERKECSINDEEFRKTIGFLAAKQRQNVAFSRAKKLLIMIGDSATLTRFYVDDNDRQISTKPFIMLKERSLKLT